MTRKEWDALPEPTKNALIELIEVAAAAMERGILPDESRPPVIAPPLAKLPAMFPIHPNDHPRG